MYLFYVQGTGARVSPLCGAWGVLFRADYQGKQHDSPKEIDPSIGGGRVWNNKYQNCPKKKKKKKL